MTIYDTIIIGGGPAGLSAGIYALRSRLNTVLIEKLACGGQMMVTDFVENYPGFPEGVSGPTLGAAIESQAKNLGLETIYAEVFSFDLSGREKIVHTSAGDYRTLTLILAMGATFRQLDIPGENRLVGKGVSYCATCDGAFFRDREIVVVGGGNTAIQDAVFLTKFASKVTIVHRRDKLRATKILQERAFKNPKIEFAWNSVAREIQGDPVMKSVVLENLKDGSHRVLPASGIFILIGTVPHTECVRGVVTLDPDGYIITDEDMQTSVPGVFAAGDCRRKSLRQMVTAAADGAIAATSAEHYIVSLSDKNL